MEKGDFQVEENFQLLPFRITCFDSYLLIVEVACLNIGVYSSPTPFHLDIVTVIIFLKGG